MRILRILSILCVLLVLTMMVIGYLFKSIQYQDSIEIQAPVSKAYTALSTHDIKARLYQDIDAKLTTIKPFREGEKTVVGFKDSKMNRMLHEKVIKLDSLKFIELDSQLNRMRVHSSWNFKDYKTVTLLEVNEKISTNSMLNRAFMVFMQQSIRKNRKAYYTRLKEIIESTPDTSFSPEEQARLNQK